MKDKEQEQPDFQNDPVTDWVLNNGEQTVETNDEIIHENADTEKKDCWFPIHFNYAGVDYTADVLKTERTVTEYHVTALLPQMAHLPDPFIFASNLSKEAYDFPLMKHIIHANWG